MVCIIQFLYLAGMIRAHEQGKDLMPYFYIESVGIKILIVFFSYFGIASYQRVCEKTERKEYSKNLMQRDII